MSLDAGGLAQMTYNNSFNGGLGLPTAGFASRGKAANVKRLSVTTAPKMGTIDETQPAPRTSRSHLLAGLRTAPKSPAVPASAPPTQLQQPGGFGGSRFGNTNGQYLQEPPKTTANGSFTSNSQNQGKASRGGHMYTPSQVLAPPKIEIGDENEYTMDPEMYEDLVRTNQYLAEQQLRLQQQLINVTAAAKQFQNLGLGQHHLQYSQNAMSPLTSVYNQQLQQGVQPIVEAVAGQPGLFVVYNPLTRQQNYFFDQGSQQQPINEQSYAQNFELSHSPPPPTPTFRAEVSPPRETLSPAPMTSWRTQTPPKISTSPPQEAPTPLPPPSANAFRPSHRKGNLSLANTALTPTTDGPKTGGLKSAGFPATPMTGTFGPGQAREGEHPIRQPRGPPALEELIAKPTSKCEGSKNFATRQRRRAVNNLVRAGIERRGASRGTGSMDDFGTPTSEHEINFSVSSDTESVRSGSASLSGKPSLGSLRPSPVAAIGSERASLKERSRERGSVDSYTASSVSSEDGSSVGGKLMEVKAEPAKDENKRKSNLAILTSAEKRRSMVF
ncbi:MAG: hypothetical protein LQ340_005906 [Diploschistes diacapsis]|nr:MAG: hypothetical protein LQ340_005906 [Diploschistes diacapsis]